MTAVEAFLQLAHVGHWSSYILYAVPVAVVLASLAKTIREERRDGEPQQPSS